MNRFSQILVDLGVSSGDSLIVYASWSRLKNIGVSPEEALKILVELVGPEGQIHMPTFPKNGLHYPIDPTLPFSISETPAATGVMSNTFLGYAGVYRSGNPYMPFAAWGKDAQAMVADIELSSSTFGPDSFIGRALKYSPKHVGLGVGVGIGMTVHLADWRYRHLSNNVLFERLVFSRVETYKSVLINRGYVVIPEHVRSAINSNLFIKKAMAEESLEVKFFIDNGVHYASYDLSSAQNLADAEAQQAFSVGRNPCWYE